MVVSMASSILPETLVAVSNGTPRIGVTVAVGLVPGIVAVDRDDHGLPESGELARERGYARHRQAVLAPRQVDVIRVRHNEVIDGLSSGLEHVEIEVIDLVE